VIIRGVGLIAVCALSLLAVPLAAEAQRGGQIPRIGLLSSFSPSDAARWHDAFRQGLRDLRWVEGKNISIEYRYAEGRSDRLPDLAADLVRLKVDIIVAGFGNDALAAKRATRTIPIVVASTGDPVTTGLVESLARPGGNVTGLSTMSPDLGGKRLALLKEILPKLSSLAVLWNPQSPGSALNWKDLQVPAGELGIHLHPLEVRSSDDFGQAFEEAIRARAGALIFAPDPLFGRNIRRIIDFAAEKRLPTFFHVREFADAGGLASYGPDRSDLFRRAASYVDKILKGAKPADLPVEQPAKFELVINNRTAKALGLTIPQALLLRADDVIE
jgi:putative tryptophan/tyrosine transport system substrate-binding protein